MSTQVQPIITQCPHCGTSFRVSEPHLNAANGIVRCGACLQVFSARNHLRADSRHEAVPPLPEQAPAKPRHEVVDSVASVKDETFAFADDADEDETFLFAAEPQDEGLLENEFTFQDETAEHNDDHLSLVNGLDDGFGGLSDSFKALKDRQANDPFVASPGQNEADAYSADEEVDESWAENMLKELEAEDHPIQLADADALALTQEPELEARKRQQLLRPDEPAHPVSPRSPSVHNLIQPMTQIHYDPMEYYQRPAHSGKAALLGWALGAWVALLLLAAQVFWQQRDHFARYEAIRGYYAVLCQRLGCSLPQQYDLSKLAIRQLVLRDPAQSSQVALVDAIIFNGAPFEQPFPDLLLIYENLNGVRVADQQFTPADYLSGELTGAQWIPPKTEVHITLFVKARSNAATSYRLDFLPRAL